jgi:NADPH:quinone reductase-like Zn-dependent oxidoreductase
MSPESYAVVLERPGALPKPVRRAAATPGPGEVLLKIGATSVNFHDYIAATGGLPDLLWPRVPFSDACGHIIALGEGVTEFAIGDRVIPNFFPDWRDGRPTHKNLARVRGDQLDGALQTHMCAAADSLVATPPHLTDTEAATLGCAGLTAWRALFEDRRLRPGGTVLVQGTGGVSLFALGFAKMMGAAVILTSSSDEKLARGLALGADHTINYKNEPAWDEAVMRITHGAGADVVIDVGGGDTLAKSIGAASVDGYIACIGVLTGFQTSDFPFANIMMKNLTLGGITVGSRRQLADMCKAITAHHFRPVVSQIFSLDQAEDAVQLMLTQKHFGKIAIAVD